MKKILPLIMLLALTGCATGSHIVTGKVRPAIAAEGVKTYPAIPAGAETIGLVTANLNASGQWAMDKVIAELKNQAGKIGGNGIVVSGMNQANPPPVYIYNPYGGTFISQNHTTASGTAIFVP